MPSPFTGRVRAMLHGIALGDALGAPVEKLSAAEIRARYGRVTSLAARWHKMDLPPAERNHRVRGNGIVKRIFQLFGGGKGSDLARHRSIQLAQAARTSAGMSLFRQSRWPSGQSRLKQGLQSSSRLRMRACVDKGGVNPGEEEP